MSMPKKRPAIANLPQACLYSSGLRDGDRHEGEAVATLSSTVTIGTRLPWRGKASRGWGENEGGPELEASRVTSEPQISPIWNIVDCFRLLRNKCGLEHKHVAGGSHGWRWYLHTMATPPAGESDQGRVESAEIAVLAASSQTQCKSNPSRRCD